MIRYIVKKPRVGFYISPYAYKGYSHLHLGVDYWNLEVDNSRFISLKFNAWRYEFKITFAYGEWDTNYDYKLGGYIEDKSR